MGKNMVIGKTTTDVEPLCGGYNICTEKSTEHGKIIIKEGLYSGNIAFYTVGDMAYAKASINR